MRISGWGAFWLFMSVFIITDSYLHTQGTNTFFWAYKTPEEKQLQQAIIERIRRGNQ